MPLTPERGWRLCTVLPLPGVRSEPQPKKQRIAPPVSPAVRLRRDRARVNLSPAAQAITPQSAAPAATITNRACRLAGVRGQIMNKGEIHLC